MQLLKREEIAARTTHRLPKKVAQLRVLSGNAWVTAYGKDLVIRQGESAMLIPGEHDAVVTALGNLPLVVEELG